MEAILKLTKKLISFHTDRVENANQAVDFLSEYLKCHGVSNRVLENRGHKMLTAEMGAGDRTVVLNGHLDVVPGREEQFVPTVKCGRLWGRGAYDMLASCAVFVRLFCECAEQGRQLPVKLVLMLVTTEETDGSLCTKYLLDQGYTGDFAICGEPTDFKTSVMCKGLLQIRMHVTGVSAHSSRTWLGENAIEKAFSIYQKICRLPFVAHKNSFYNGATVCLSALHAGTVINRVPDEAIMDLDIRYVPGDDGEEILRQIQQLAGETKIEVIKAFIPVLVPEGNAYVAALCKAVEDCTGKFGATTAQYGASDAVFFQEKGIPAVEFGPVGAGLHGDQEYAEVSSLSTYQSILTAFIAGLSEEKGEDREA